MFFEKFPVTLFKVDTDSSLMVTDFIRAVKVDPELMNNIAYYTTYYAKDNETAEIISHRFYGSTQYHWVIMLLNHKFNPYDDFPKSEDIVMQQCIKKFNNPLGIHHYEMDGEWVDEFAIDKNPVTNYEWMINENEKKRFMKILKQEILSEFVQSYESAIRNG